MNKFDLAPSLCKVGCEELEHDCVLDGALFCAGFEMKDPTVLPEDAKRLLYALHVTHCCVELGEVKHCFVFGKFGREGGLIHECKASPVKGAPPCIVECRSGRSVGFMRVQLRLYRRDSKFFVMVVASVPMALSLRHAVFETLQQKARCEEMRRTWQMLASVMRSDVMLSEDVGWIVGAQDCEGCFNRLFSAQVACGDGSFVSGTFDHDMDAAVGPKKKKKKRSREEEAEEEEEEGLLGLQSPLCMELDGGDRYGLPACQFCMDVHVAPSAQCNYRNFENGLRVFPQALVEDICAEMLGVELLGREEDRLSCRLCKEAVSGGYEPLGSVRARYANGEADWHDARMRSIMQQGGGSRLERLEELVGMGVVFAITRADGSDCYTNGRVAEYLKRTRLGGSVEECRRVHSLYSERGLFGVSEVLHSCNEEGLHLRPDNLFLLEQLLISDVMQGLNFFGGVIEGAPNGIGCTIVVRDGGGHYRRQGGSVEVCSKMNGSGVDTTMAVHKSLCGLFCACEDVFKEIRQSSNMGLLLDVCNKYEGNAGSQSLVHTVRNTSLRLYASELVLQSGNNTVSALSQLVTRNTNSVDLNSYRTTEENTRTKQRVAIEYLQVLFGIMLLCGNMTPDAVTYERVVTICRVVRNVASAAQGVPMVCPVPAGREGELDVSSSNPEVGRVRDTARAVYGTCLGVAMSCGFLQWSGILGRLPSHPVMETLKKVFRAQLMMSLGLLDPSMTQASTLARYLQIGEARNVAHSLLGTAMESVCEAGRRGKGEFEAIKLCSLRLMRECTSLFSFGSMVCDTVEHLVRLDFVLLMQMAASVLEVPLFKFGEVMDWLERGGGAVGAYVSSRSFVACEELDGTLGAGLTGLRHCMYVTCMDTLSFPVGDGVDVVEQGCKFVGSRLFFKFVHSLKQYCQLHVEKDGESILQSGLLSNVNRMIEWPCIFGGTSLFWSDAPADAYQREKRVLAPLRLVQVERRKGCLCVDLRWLLLMRSMCGSVPSQSMRFSLAAFWGQSFFKACVPDQFVCCSRLYTGLPKPNMHGGMLMPVLRRTGRRFFLRPRCESATKMWACDLSASGLVEDLGAALSRYLLARRLCCTERDLPTESVEYDLPIYCGTVVLVESSGRYGLLFRDEERWVLQEGDREENVSGNAYLRGRLSVAVRPLPNFDRTGVCVRLEDGSVDSVEEFSVASGGYLLCKSRRCVDPLVLESMVVSIGTKLVEGVLSIPEEEDLPRGQLALELEDGTRAAFAVENLHFLQA